MIQITLYSQGDEITGFACTGHAGYAEYGSDIVCAAVSILTTTCANALETVAGVKPQVQAAEGDMALSLPDGAGRDAQVILMAMRQGLRDLAEAYPENLRLIEK